MSAERQFVAYFWFNGWDNWSLGLHVCPTKPNVEIHVPFGFFRIGWESIVTSTVVVFKKEKRGWCCRPHTSGGAFGIGYMDAYPNSITIEEWKAAA